MYTIFFYNIYKMTVVEEQEAQKKQAASGNLQPAIYYI